MIMAKGSCAKSEPLVAMAAGETRRIERVSGAEDQTRRLAELGLVEGAEVSVLSRSRTGFLIKVGGSRLALAGGMADGVWVK